MYTKITLMASKCSQLATSNHRLIKKGCPENLEKKGEIFK